MYTKFKQLSFSKLVFAQQIQIVVSQLLQEGLVWFDFVHEPSQKSQSVLQLHFLSVNQIGQDEGRCPALALD